MSWKVEIEMRKHVVFVQHETVSICKHERIFFHFIVSFRNTEKSYPQCFSYSEFSRADEISYVFNEYDIKVIQRKVVNDFTDTHGLDMACSVGVKLDGRYAELGDPFCIDLSCNVAFDNSYMQLLP